MAEGRFLAGGTSEVGGDDVGRVPVQAAAGAVIPHRGARIGMRGSFLHIPQRHPGVQRRGDERVPQRVRSDRLGEPSTVRGPADDPRRTVAVQPPAVGGQEQRPVAALADGQVDRPGSARRKWNGNDLAAFADDHQSPVAALGAERLDVGTGGFGDPQPVQRKQ